MSVRSFRSVFMVGGVAAAALGCYLVSLRVASERAALEGVETEIVLAQRDIRLLQTEIGTRGRLAQLERWNVKVLALSAPSADQFVADGFQLAQLVTPHEKPVIDAPMVYAAAPAAPPPAVLPETDQPEAQSPQLLHEASFKLPDRSARARAAPGLDTKPAPSAKAAPAAAAKPKPETAAAKLKPETKAAAAKAVPHKAAAPKAAAKPDAAKPAEAKPVRFAKADPLAPLPSKAKPAKPAAKPTSATTRDSGKQQ